MSESNVTQAHIHVGQKNVNGGIVVWLCSNLTGTPNPTPPGTQACPLRSGTISGTITGSNIVGPASQGVTSEEMDELIKAIRDGNTYVTFIRWYLQAEKYEARSGPDNAKSHH